MTPINDTIYIYSLVLPDSVCLVEIYSAVAAVRRPAVLATAYRCKISCLLKLYLVFYSHNFCQQTEHGS